MIYMTNFRNLLCWSKTFSVLNWNKKRTSHGLTELRILWIAEDLTFCYVHWENENNLTHCDPSDCLRTLSFRMGT